MSHTSSVQQRCTATVAVAAVLITCFSSIAVAHATHQTAIPNGDKVVRNGVAWPGVGHMVAGGGGLQNAFGIAFAAAGHTWTNALCIADTDGDGITNGAELGDPGCVWTPGSIPERVVDITHPGFADSQPSAIVLSFRLVGPSASEGVLQARVYPKPWGTVNFPTKLGSDWARGYCETASQLDDTRLARAFRMADRPAGDQQYLAANQYVSVSDPSGCGTEGSIMSCAFAYSDPGVPQNTTSADTDGTYVDCKYNLVTGTQAKFHPTRVLSPDPGRGNLEMLLPGAAAWVPAQVVLGLAGIAVDTFVCGDLLGFDANAFAPVKRPAQGSKTFEITVATPTADESLVNSTTTYGTVTASRFEYECAAMPSPVAGTFSGPSLLELIGTVNHGPTQAAFVAQIASTYGVTAGDVTVRFWNEQSVIGVTYFALHLTSTTENSNHIVRRMATDDSVAFGIIASRFEHVPDATQPATLPTFRIDGPSAGTGVVQARYGADAWGLVNWHFAASNLGARANL